MKEMTRLAGITKRAGEKSRTFIIDSWACLVKALFPRCPICDERLHRDQLMANWHVAHLGENVTVHRSCAPAERNRRSSHELLA